MWVAVGTVVGGGVATFLAVLGGAAVAARHFRREREQRSAVAILAALAGYRQGTNFMTAESFPSDERTEMLRKLFEAAGREMKDAAEGVRREEGLAPTPLVAAVEELRRIAWTLEGDMYRVALPGYPTLDTPPGNAATALERRVDAIDTAVRAWLAADVHWWRRAELTIPAWDNEGRAAVDQYLAEVKANIYYLRDPDDDEEVTTRTH